MGFHVDLKELTKAAQKLQQEANQLEEQLATAKNQVNHIISTEALQGKTGQAIYQQLNNVDAAILVGLRDTTKLLVSDLASLVVEFQATVGETASDAVLDEDYLNQLKDNLTTYQNQHGVHEESISSIYAGISDLISLSGPQSQYDADTATATQDLSNTIDKVTSFDSASTEPNSEALLAAINSKVNQASQTTALAYTDSQYLSFISDVDFAKGIKSIDKQITQQEKLAQEQAEKEAKANWAKQHPVVALLQTISDETTKLFQWANQEVQDYDLNIPGANYVKDQISLRLGFISKACETVGDLAIGTAQLSQLVFEGVEWGRNTVWKKETPQWIKDDVVGTAMTIATTTSFVNRLQLGDTNAWKTLYKGLEESTSQIANNIISGNNFEIGGYLFDVVTLVYPGTATSELKYVDEASNLAKLAETSEVASTVGKVEDGVSLSFEKLMSAEDTQKYVAWNNFAKNGISAEERLKILDDGIYSPKTYIEFLKANPSQNVDDYIELVRGQSPWPKGYVPKYKTLKSGDMFEMALSPGQEDFEPGGFATELGTIKNVDYVRQKLAVKIDWKKEIDRVCVYRVKDGVSLPVQIGPVGPQIDLRLDQYLPGGASQKEFLLPRDIDKMDYLDIVTDLCREIY